MTYWVYDSSSDKIMNLPHEGNDPRKRNNRQHDVPDAVRQHNMGMVPAMKNGRHDKCVVQRNGQAEHGSETE